MYFKTTNIQYQAVKDSNNDTLWPADPNNPGQGNTVETLTCTQVGIVKWTENPSGWASIQYGFFDDNGTQIPQLSTMWFSTQVPDSSLLTFRQIVSGMDVNQTDIDNMAQLLLLSPQGNSSIPQ